MPYIRIMHICILNMRYAQYALIFRLLPFAGNSSAVTPEKARSPPPGRRASIYSPASSLAASMTFCATV